MELIQLGSRTYYIKNRTNIGIYMTGSDKVCIIDTGSKGDGQKIDEILMAQGWKPDYIINTHNHIDHLGGNEYLMRKYDIPAYGTAYDRAFANYSDLEAAYMNGGYPCKDIRRVFYHPMIDIRTLEHNELPGIGWVYLPGHTFGMAGIKTDDSIWFLGDAYIEGESLRSGKFVYLYDVEGYLDTLEKLKVLDGNYFVPAHGNAERDIKQTVCMNLKNVNRIMEIIRGICAEYISLENILKNVYEKMNLRVTMSHHAIISSTVKCYLTYLQDRDELECGFIDNVMVWKCK